MKKNIKKILLVGPLVPKSFKPTYWEIDYEGWGFNWSRGQGPWHHGGFATDVATHLIANNISTPTVVLDHPKEEDFKRELKENHYDLIGMSFLTNLSILRCGEQMVSIIKEISPNSRIIIGGYGVLTPGIDKILHKIDPCVEIHKGEGISHFRSLLNESQGNPIKNPRTLEATRPKVFNYQLDHPYQNHQFFVPAVGCENACPFCQNSKMYCQHVARYYKNGKEIFDDLIRVSSGKDKRKFFFTDPNFLKSHKEIMPEFHSLSVELLDKQFCLHVFSDIKSLHTYSGRFLAECGVEMVFTGFEGDAYSKDECGDKNNNMSVAEIGEFFRDLNDWGIQTNVSTIVVGPEQLDTFEKCKENLADHISLDPTWSQLTALYPHFGSQLFDKVNPNKEKKEFTSEELKKLMRAIVEMNMPEQLKGQWLEFIFHAYKTLYEQLGPSFLNYFIIKLRGFLKYKEIDSAYFHARAELYRKECVVGLPYMLAYLKDLRNRHFKAYTKYEEYVRVFEKEIRMVQKSDHEESEELLKILKRACKEKKWYWVPSNISDTFYEPQYIRTEYNFFSENYHIPNMFTTFE